jgi:hypothetical protein
LALLERQDGEAVFAEVEPVFVPVQPAPDTEVREVGLALNWSDPAQLVAPAWQGVVDRVLVAPGDRVAHGSALLSLDGIERIAWATSGAFYRQLALRDKGPDVEWLNQALAAAGLRHAAGAEFTAETAAGVKEFAASIGAPANNGVFDPGWVVFLPIAELVIKEVAVSAGLPAPPPGSVLLQAQVQLVSAVLIGLDVLERRESEANDQAGAVDPVAPADEVLAVDETLLVDGLDLALNDARDGLGPQALATLDGRVQPGLASLRAQVRRPSGADAVRVPTAAVFDSGGGSACVVVAAGAGDPGVVEVELIWDDSGFSVVRPLLEGALDGAKVRLPGGGPAAVCG